MYISKKDKKIIEQKYDGLCAYSGTPLEKDWQVDHIKPLRRFLRQYEKKNHNIENMIPVQRIINHYKGGRDLETFREWFLGGIHTRLRKLPKHPRTEKSIRHKKYMLEVAGFFNITENKPFSGKFYFETINKNNKKIT